jgi:hypothetical protein
MTPWAVFLDEASDGAMPRSVNMRSLHHPVLLALVASIACTAFGCAAELPPPSTPIVEAPPTPAAAVAASTGGAASEAKQEVAQAPAGSLYCTATTDGSTRELYLDWKGDKANGTLRTSNAKGVVQEEAVRAERTKARVVIADPAKPDATARKATIVLKGDAKKIQVGDGKQPWTSCR